MMFLMHYCPHCGILYHGTQVLYTDCTLLDDCDACGEKMLIVFIVTPCDA